jgi:hypothetical protein
LVTGTITANQVDSSGKAVIFCPIIDFTTKAGEPVTYEGGDCVSHPNQIQIGQQVQVYYDPQNTKNIQTGQGSLFVQYANAAGFPFFFGCLFLVMGLGMIVVALGLAARQHKLEAAFEADAKQRAERMEQMRPLAEGAGESGASLLAQEEKLYTMDEAWIKKIEERRRQKGL